MMAGLLDQRASFFRRADSDAASAAYAHGEARGDFVLVLERWCQLRPVDGAEFTEAGGATDRQQVRITIRNDRSARAITSHHRVRVAGVDYAITSVIASRRADTIQMLAHAIP